MLFVFHLAMIVIFVAAASISVFSIFAVAFRNKPLLSLFTIVHSSILAILIVIIALTLSGSVMDITSSEGDLWQFVRGWYGIGVILALEFICISSGILLIGCQRKRDDHQLPTSIIHQHTTQSMMTSNLLPSSFFNPPPANSKDYSRNGTSTK